MKHNSVLYRVVYLVNGDEGKKQFKDLPHFWIGKRIGKRKDLDGEELKSSEELGQDATERQINCSIFSIENKFKRGERVLIANDEKGGFINGKIEVKKKKEKKKRNKFFSFPFLGNGC